MSLTTTRIPVSDTNINRGLSHYNWVCRPDFICSPICGASLKVAFRGTRSVSLNVDASNITAPEPGNYPIIAWSVNDGPLQTDQLAKGETIVPLAEGVNQPIIDLYIRGMSPFDDRYTGDVPSNSLKITGFTVDENGTTAAVPLPSKIWLNIGDSIMSGDAAAYAEGQGRPPDDAWAASDESRASYGYLLAQHYGYRESRLAYGGYNWRGGMAGIPSLDVLLDHLTTTAPCLQAPFPDLVLINLGENGPPAREDVTKALVKLRSRIGATAKIIVMVPVSGTGRTEVTSAFSAYQSSTEDQQAFLIDLGKITYATSDGQHLTAAGYRTIYEAARPAFDPLVTA